MKIPGLVHLSTAACLSVTAISALAQGTPLQQQISPASTLNALLSETDSYRLTKAVAAYVESVSPNDLQSAVHEVELSRGPGKIQVLSVLVSKWAESNLTEAILETRKPGDRETTAIIITSVFTVLARHDLTKALTEVHRMPWGGVILIRNIDPLPLETTLDHTQQYPAEKRQSAMIAVVRTEMEIDPAKALQVILEFRKDYFWEDGLYIVFDRWPQKDLAAATAALQELPLDLRTEAARTIANSLVWKDPQSAIIWASQLPEGQMRSTVIGWLAIQWAQKDPAAASRYVESFARKPDRDFFLSEIVGQWSATDPRSAIEFIDRLPANPQKKMMLHAALEAWALGDFNAALPRIQKIVAIKEKNSILNDTLGAWVNVDTAAAMAWVQTLPPSERGFAWSNALSSLGQKNPALAAEWFGKIPDYPRKNDSVENFAFSWQQKDPEAAWNWVQKLPDSELKNQVSSGVLGAIVPVDLKSAMAHVEALPEGAFKDACLEAITRSLLSYDVKGALSLLETATPSGARDDCLSSLVAPLMNADPKFATIYGQSYPWHGSTRGDGNQVGTFPPKAQREEFLRYTLPAWFEQDPSGAAAWLTALPDDEVKHHLLLDSARAWATADIDAATAYALTLPTGSIRSDFIENIVEEMADNDPDKAIAWAKQLKDPSESKLFQRNVIEYLGRADPEVAVKYTSSISNQSLRLEITKDVAPEWARNDPAAAGHWVETLPESKEKGDTLSLVAQRWVDVDPEKAGAWADGLPPGSSRDSALYGYSHRLYENDHGKIALAYQWAQKIADPTQRQTLETYLLGQWMIIDAATAKAILAKSNLPEDVKTQVLKGQSP